MGIYIKRKTIAWKRKGERVIRKLIFASCFSIEPWIIIFCIKTKNKEIFIIAVYEYCDILIIPFVKMRKDASIFYAYLISFLADFLKSYAVHIL